MLAWQVRTLGSALVFLHALHCCGLPQRYSFQAAWKKQTEILPRSFSAAACEWGALARKACTVITWDICESLNLCISTAEPVLLRQVARRSLSWSRAWEPRFQLARLLFSLIGSGEDCGTRALLRRGSLGSCRELIFHVCSILPERPDA